MNTRELIEFQTQVEYEIYRHADELGLSSETLWPILDGICDIEAYLSSSLKIMWVMKEPYDEISGDGKPEGGGWSIVNDCFDKEDAWRNRSWQPIIYLMYGFYNRMYWEDMDWIRDNLDMVQIMKRIAYINISKMPALTTSNEEEIGKAYELWKDILHRQIEGYNPDVIIFGNTYQHFAKYFGSPECFKQHVVGGFNYINEYRANGKCLLWVYHPAARPCGFSRGDYVNTIIDALTGFSQSQ